MTITNYNKRCTSLAMFFVVSDKIACIKDISLDAFSAVKSSDSTHLQD